MSTSPQARACGAWPSPITAQRLTQASLRFGELVIDGQDVYWVESRPQDKGRSVVCKGLPSGEVRDVTPEGFGVRSLVNSYGGASFNVIDGEIFFSAYRAEGVPEAHSKYRDQRLFRQRPGEAPAPLTDGAPGSFWADAIKDRARGRLIVVREDQLHSLHGQPLQTLCAVPLDGLSEPVVLQAGADFYAYPRLSPDGRQLAWISWNYPDMAWDSAELWVAQIDGEGALVHPKRIAGGQDEAAMQPEWSADGVLHFASDRTDWWNLYTWHHGKAHLIHGREAEFSEALWSLGSSRYGVCPDGSIVCAYREHGRWNLATLDPVSGALKTVETPYTEISNLRVGDGFVAFCGTAPNVAPALVRRDLKSGKQLIYRVATDLPLDALAPWLSTPEAIEFPTRDGGSARAFYYPPTNPEFKVPEGELPPLIVRSHGGPTGSASTGLQLGVQFFTSRGFAVVDVDYRGSTGYGRTYRLSLYGHWGERDIFDCADAALHLVKRGDVDGERVVAAGGSAGGYITLGLVAFTDLLKAGVSYYGISSLEMIVQHSDKLEAFYPFKLIGPYPEEAALYRARSPLHHVDTVSCPVCFFQGLEDPIVPPEQTRVMVEGLRARGVPVAAVYYEGEQHGFRNVENVRSSLEGELSFYAQVLGFTPADDIPRLHIEGFDGTSRP